jgi:2,3-bisphosphoglycerate-independent phosphoglycerate mutase
MQKKTSVALIVLDGFGLGEQTEANPIYTLHPLVFRYLSENYPFTSLAASGISVGLPWGETGNSEVGHLTLGAGRVVYQHYPRITLSIQDGSFFENENLKRAIAHAKQNGSAIHFAGLLTKAHTHASIEHLSALLKMAAREQCGTVWLHLFGDAKDSPPRSIRELLDQVPFENIGCVIGRYYAMDREQNWSLTKTAYEMMVNGTGAPFASREDLDGLMEKTFEKNLSEEYLPPLCKNGFKGIQDNDALVFFNFREDSIRQIAQSFIEDSVPFARQKRNNLFIATMTTYKENFAVPVLFPPIVVENPLGQVISEAGLTQLRVAETYKYAHITYFFNGLKEEPFQGEYRVLIPSAQVAHPDEHPEMMARSITDRVIQGIENRSFDFILANYANPDTIGHTGNYEASLQVTKIMDEEIGKILKVAEKSDDFIVIITSDHGNMERVYDPISGRPDTQHDPNPVPFYLVNRRFKGKKFFGWNLRTETIGSLADVAPTILALLGIEKPAAMIGKNLLVDIQ